MAAPQAPQPSWTRWRGTVGQLVRIQANAFRVDWNGQHFWEYDGERRSSERNGISLILFFASAYIMNKAVSSRAQTERDQEIGKSKARELMQRLQVEVYPHIFGGQGSYDGNKILWSTRELQLPEGPSGEARTISFTLPWTRPNPQAPLQSPTMVTIRITFAKLVEKRYLRNVVLGMGSSNLMTGEPFEQEEAATALNALNVIFQHAPSIGGAVRNGRRIFASNVGNARRMGPFLLVQGYFQSVRPIPQGLMVNIDVVGGLLIDKEDLSDFAAEYLGISRAQLREGSRGSLSGQNYQKLRYALKGLRIETTMSSRPRRYRINDLVKHAGRVEFDKGSEKITVAEHYLQTYNVQIRNPDLFGVQVGRRDHPIILPLECCRIVKPQLYNKQPPPRIQGDIVRFSAKPPRERKADIEHARVALAYDTSVTLAAGGLSVEKDLARIEGRLLEPPQLQFGGQERMVFRSHEVGTWNVTRYRFADPKPIKLWAIIDLASTNQPVVYALGQELLKVMRARGMAVTGDPTLGQLTSPDVKTIKEFLFRLPGKPDLVVFILPQNSPDIYRLVKRLGDIEIQDGLVTQCVTAGKQYNNQYCNNLTLKINVKLGGVNSYVTSSVMDHLKAEGVMALGADVSHPTDLSQPSVAALVSSWDDRCTKYVASIRIQRPRQEVIEDMQEMVERALRCYWDAHEKTLPRVLLFYRDGVSEGEYRTLAITEVAAIKAAFMKAYGSDPTKWPQLVFIIVGKRHHIRFFPEGDADKTGNCRSGLVVDQAITHPTEFDWYLQSQPGLKGTSRPSHYVAIINSNSRVLGADILQQLSYGLCFAYARASRAVSIPAPVYYADLVCRRAKFHYDDQVALNADYSSDTSGDFNLAFWQQHFTAINSKMANKMYFV
ncbi:Piwi-domain-containing protein [Heliocybe sulcata]|uniref:Piwi-domain-containing protein n=1 Tax=Heliocybe sulcata TaxID=5364 RepID=A0A5C3NHU9_9AGAM|nr:Piwi-domain-containing protein [Heliocybe sulcata]